MRGDFSSWRHGAPFTEKRALASGDLSVNDAKL
jgi:hypothetical protein